MICQGCGHNFPNTLTRCPKCKLAPNRKGQRSSDSRLIEFPKKARLSQQSDQSEASLPAWRLELNEKVRASRARRNNPALQTTASEASSISLSEAEKGAGAAAVRQTEIRARTRAAPDTRAFAHSAQKESVVRTDRESLEAGQTRGAQRSSNHIVEAALTRVRRASENASRAALPKIEPVRPITQTSPLALDKEATARELEPSPEITRQSRPEPITLSKPAPSPVAKTAIIEEPAIAVRKIEPKHASAADESFDLPSQEMIESSSFAALDELEPLDYLEAEIRKVDRVLSAELSRTDSPSLFTHFVINAIDLMVIAISSLPFVALVGLYNGTFDSSQTRVASGAIIALVSFFYLALTQNLCGKTFGMMFTNTKIVDARTAEPVSSQRALLRTCGYFLAALPALVGFAWAIFNRNHRGLHDYISRTQIAGDF
jgi:uncharacterized RDD family membrane protein YckC